MFFEVVCSPEDAAEVPRIERMLLAAAARTARWGAFREGVRIRVVPDHASLEEAVGRPGHVWLRAWSYSDQILLQSPRSWSPDDAELTELLAHELTHALMYQRMQPTPAWAAEEPPLWFREGMASVTAGQGHRRLDVAELRRWVAANPQADLLHPAPELYRDQKEAVYGAAHRAFELLQRSAGDDAIRDVLRRASLGVPFPEAFRSAIGQSLTDFEHAAVQTGFGAGVPRVKSGLGSGGL